MSLIGLLVFLIAKFLAKNGRFKKLITFICNKLFFNAFFRTGIQAYLGFSLSFFL